MFDNNLIQIFRPLIVSGLADYGVPVVNVRQSYQPTQQGTESGVNVYFFKIGDHRYGSVESTDIWSETFDAMIHTEMQHYETTFQVSALSIQDPTLVFTYTASDVVNIVSAILQSDNTQQVLESNDVGILRITDIRNPYFMNDKDVFEASPSFDFILSHKQSRQITSPIITSTNIQIFQL